MNVPIFKRVQVAEVKVFSVMNRDFIIRFVVAVLHLAFHNYHVVVFDFRNFTGLIGKIFLLQLFSALWAIIERNNLVYVEERAFWEGALSL